jgi:hypothetical protein
LILVKESKAIPGRPEMYQRTMNTIMVIKNAFFKVIPPLLLSNQIFFHVSRFIGLDSFILLF